MNNRFCRCCFSDHNADDTLCRGFRSHLSDHELAASQRSGETGWAGSSVSLWGAAALEADAATTAWGSRWLRPRLV